jgi:hypothetical protein
MRLGAYEGMKCIDVFTYHHTKLCFRYHSLASQPSTSSPTPNPHPCDARLRFLLPLAVPFPSSPHQRPPILPPPLPPCLHPRLEVNCRPCDLSTRALKPPPPLTFPPLPPCHLTSPLRPPSRRHNERRWKAPRPAPPQRRQREIRSPAPLPPSARVRLSGLFLPELQVDGGVAEPQVAGGLLEV